MKYKCLVLDHDDTVVNSTATIHYPAFLETLSVLRPEVKISLNDFFLLNFDPGFMEYCTDVLNFTNDEIKIEYKIWQEHVRTSVPVCFPDMRRLILRQKESGGYVCVVSHSVKETILRDYIHNDLPKPDLIFGWELPPKKRKPSTYPLHEIKKNLGLSFDDMIVIDDLLPGLKMARGVNVCFAAAQWAYNIKGISEIMAKEAPICFKSINALEKHLFD